MFHDWDNFYLLVGSAAAALIGLLFVVVTLTSSLEKQSASTGASVYMTPTVFHFGVVLVLSGLALAPGVAPLATGQGVGFAAVAGMVYAGFVAVWIHQKKVSPTPHWSDFWWYGVAPLVLYLGLAIDGVVLTDGRHGTAAMAASLMALLLVGVRNAWDLVTFLAPRKNGGEQA